LNDLFFSIENLHLKEKKLYFCFSMGCLKLTYSQQDTPLKVVYRKTEPQQKGVQRFLSVDPLADKYPSTSPYMYCRGNPISRIDPNGMWDELVITGDEADKAVAQMQSATTMTLTRDPNTGKVTAAGEAKTENDKKLLSVINSTEITVNVDASNSSTFEFNGQTYGTRGGGAFLGNTVTNSTLTTEFQTGIKPFEMSSYTYDITTVNAYQFVNPNMLEDFDIFAGTPGNAMLHEVTEAYSGALISQKTGVSAQPANSANSTYWIYEQAHRAKTTVPQPGDGVITESDLIRIRLMKTK
jgi:RHS repeat-associated protein